MSKRTVLAAALFLAFTVPASAQVGGVVITQATAAVGNVTPGDTAGFPVTISRSGLYKLGSDLLVTSPPPPAVQLDAIVVTAFDVTIDLNGYRLHAFGKGDEGIASTQPSVTIRNGTIAGFRIGIRSAGNFWIVEDMRIVANFQEGILATGFGSVFRNNIIADNGNSGGGYPGVNCSASCLIEGNVISRNGGIGVLLGSGGTVLGIL